MILMYIFGIGITGIIGFIAGVLLNAKKSDEQAFDIGALREKNDRLRERIKELSNGEE